MTKARDKISRRGLIKRQILRDLLGHTFTSYLACENQAVLLNDCISYPGLANSGIFQEILLGSLQEEESLCSCPWQSQRCSSLHHDTSHQPSFGYLPVFWFSLVCIRVALNDCAMYTSACPSLGKADHSQELQQIYHAENEGQAEELQRISAWA